MPFADALQRAKGKPLLRVPVPSRALVFEFESEVDRDQAVDVITPILKEAQRKGKAPVADPQRPASGLQGPQAALKQHLLQEDRCSPDCHLQFQKILCPSHGKAADEGDDDW